MQIKGGEIIVRAPLRMQKDGIDRFLEDHRDWIEENLKKAMATKAKIEKEPPLT